MYRVTNRVIEVTRDPLQCIRLTKLTKSATRTFFLIFWHPQSRASVARTMYRGRARGTRARTAGKWLVFGGWRGSLKCIPRIQRLRDTANLRMRVFIGCLEGAGVDQLRRARRGPDEQYADENKIICGEADWASGRRRCPFGRGAVMRVTRRSEREEYRKKQREHVEGSPSLANRFPRLKKLKVVLEYFDATGTNKQREMKCTLNVEHAKSALVFTCPGGECMGGDFDLSEALAKAVAGRRKTVTGELRCQGQRRRGERERVPCQTLLRYKLSLNYD